MHFFFLILFAAMAGFLGMYLYSQRVLRRRIAEMQRELQEQVDALKKAQKVGPAAAPAAVVPVVAAPKPAVEEEVAPEILLVIAAAVTAFLGKKVRIRSARALQTPYEIVNPWAQQGRVFVQASHNVAQRVH